MREFDAFFPPPHFVPSTTVHPQYSAQQIKLTEKWMEFFSSVEIGPQFPPFLLPLDSSRFSAEILHYIELIEAIKQRKRR